MKKTLGIIMVILITLVLAACGASAATSTPSPSAAAPAVVTFADPVLEAKVRAAMGRPEGDITAAEAEAVTEMNFGIEWQIDVSEEMQITDLGGLEYFKNLKSLNLSSHAITDISPLKGLTKLTLLSLGGNPVIDISPLKGLTNLKMLTLSGCAAQDYSDLSGLVNLEILVLDGSAITDISALSGLTRLTYLSLAHTQTGDVSPLVSLTSLKQLYLADCPVADYSPLTEIYSTLEEKDFTVASTLAELGFIMDDGAKQAIYDGERASVRINHIEWGAPPEDGLTNCVRTVFTQNDYKIDIGYYPNLDAYVILANKDGNSALNYIYDHAKNSFTFGMGDRESSELAVRAMLADVAAEDVLLAPISIFNDAIQSTFSMTANALYSLPFEPKTLKSLGFAPDETNAAYAYHKHEPHDMHISIYRPEWGDSSDGRSIEFYDDDVNGYSLLILYFADPGGYHIALFKDGMDCAFEMNPATDDYGEEYPDLDTVHQMFNAAFGTKEKELYHKPLNDFEQVVQEWFGMSIDELYALPVGE